MIQRDRGNLRLGSNVVELLLPHRPPLLLVDFVEHFEDGDEPRLRAGKQVSANEPVFTGHFADLHLYPGIYVIEGLGQATHILAVLCGIRQGYADAGREPDEVLAELENLDRGFRLHPGFDAARAARFREAVGDTSVHLGLASAVELKFLAPVFAGQRLEYLVSITHRMENLNRCAVEARVDGKTVARGTLTGATGFTLPGFVP